MILVHHGEWRSGRDFTASSRRTRSTRQGYAEFAEISLRV